MNIRKLEPDDIPSVISLGRQFAEFERLIDSYKVTSEKIYDVVFGDDRFVNILVVEKDGSIVGYALFYPCFASFRGERSMFLEDIYISSDHRGGGIGEALLREVARFAHSRGCQRIDFQVLDWNRSAIAFYEKLGAECNEDESHFKFESSSFADLAA